MEACSSVKGAVDRIYDQGTKKAWPRLLGGLCVLAGGPRFTDHRSPVHQAKPTAKVRNRMNGAPSLQLSEKSFMKPGLQVSFSVRGLKIKKSFRFKSSIRGWLGSNPRGALFNESPPNLNSVSSFGAVTIPFHSSARLTIAVRIFVAVLLSGCHSPIPRKELSGSR